MNENQPAPAGRVNMFDEASIRRLRILASDALRKRNKPTDPTTLSIVDQVVMNLIRASERGGEPELRDERELTMYLSGAIRNHFVTLARRNLAARRPQESKRQAWPETDIFPGTKDTPGSVLDVHVALEELATEEPQAAKIVEMMFFGGCTQAEVAEALGSTIDRIRADWEFARAWLRRRLASGRRD